MAYRRRPRTKVYDCNYNLGESYYKPVMDSLDRKLSRGVDPVTPAGERESTPSSRFSRLVNDRELEREREREMDNTPSSRAGKLLAEFENGLDAHRGKSRGSTLADDDDAAIDAEFEETMRRIKTARAQKNAEWDEEMTSFAGKKKINMADQLLDSVGINSKSQRVLEDDVISKHKRQAKKFYDEEDDKVMSKWTAVRPGGQAMQDAEEAVEGSSAMARARKSRARMQDIDAELEELAAKGAARQRRIQELRALVGEDETSSSSASASSSVRVSKRVSVKSSSEKKHVTF